MNNVRGLYPPLYGAPANGGGGGGGSIQVETLPEASLEYKNKIVQYTGATTETLTNGYFYKCVEHTETEGSTITVTYSWDNISVMSTNYNNKILQSAHYTVSDVQSVISNNTVIVDSNFATNYNAKRVVGVEGYILTADNDATFHLQVPISQAVDPTRLATLIVVNDAGELRIVFTYTGGSYIPRYVDLVVYFYESEVI